MHYKPEVVCGYVVKNVSSLKFRLVQSKVRFLLVIQDGYIRYPQVESCEFVYLCKIMQIFNSDSR